VLLKINVPLPVLLSVLPEPLTKPLKVNEPLSVLPILIVELGVRAIVPAYEAVPVEVKLPFKVRASAPIATLLILSVAPEATVAPPAVAPRAEALFACTVPAFTVRPLYVLTPERINVLLPTFVIGLAPEIMPPKVNEPLSVLPIVVAPVVVIAPPAEAAPVLVIAPVLPIPVPLTEIKLAFNATLLIFNAAPEAIVVVDAILPKAEALPALKRPALMLLPLCVFVPERVSWPEPILVNANAPVRLLVKLRLVKLLLTSIVLAAPMATVPVMLSLILLVPLTTASKIAPVPLIPVPEIVTFCGRASADVPPNSNCAPLVTLTVAADAPKAWLFIASATPALIAVLPV